MARDLVLPAQPAAQQRVDAGAELRPAPGARHRDAQVDVARAIARRFDTRQGAVAPVDLRARRDVAADPRGARLKHGVRAELPREAEVEETPSIMRVRAAAQR